MSCLDDLGLSIEGGRVFGPPGFDWRPATRQDWNVGGERVWLAPEALLNYEDPARIIETYKVEPALDPGNWRVRHARDSVTLSARIDLGPQLRAEVTRRLTCLPARLGYRQEISVTADRPVVPWLIRQLAPGWRVYIPQGQPSKGARIFGAPPDQALEGDRDFWQADFHGAGFYKTAYQASALTPWALTCRRPGGALLWHIHPAPQGAVYPEHLPGHPDTPGLGLSLFYDDGRFGHYGEIEAYGYLAGGIGRLVIDTICLAGNDLAPMIATLQATEISSTPIS